MDETSIMIAETTSANAVESNSSETTPANAAVSNQTNQYVYRKFLPMMIGRNTCTAVVDSGSSANNAIALAVVETAGLVSCIEEYTEPKINTAKKGSTLKIIGVIKRLRFGLFNSLSRKYLFCSPFIVVEHLYTGINLSGPWLAKHRFNQIHKQGVLRRDGADFPLFPTASTEEFISISTTTATDQERDSDVPEIGKRFTILSIASSPYKAYVVGGKLEIAPKTGTVLTV